jgi:transcriptional regulator with XRE-family HTH domain
MEQEKIYTIKELFEDLPLSLRQFAEQIGTSEVTLARIRDGRPTRRHTANKLLLAFSSQYQQKFTLRNVTGINITDYNPKGRKKTRDETEDGRDRQTNSKVA